MQVTIFRKKQKTLSLDKNNITKILKSACIQIGLEKKYPGEIPQLNVCIVDRKKIIELNEEFLRHAGETDVIAFAYEDEDLDIAGEIYVCEDVAKDSAEKYNNSFSEELILYMIHGMLHLAGYDDTNDKDRRKMKKAEQENMDILKQKFKLEKIFSQ
ncbi:MAG: rRNA maturation RNase YbeY [Verrucomicrobiota bacterium]|nr:rRNA maturation RNase YbeY [Verrucomicrobiota bacterium]